jgi:hypothetical protein
MYICVLLCVYVYVCVCAPVCVRAHVCAPVYLCIHVCAPVYLGTYVCAHACAHTLCVCDVTARVCMSEYIYVPLPPSPHPLTPPPNPHHLLENISPPAPETKNRKHPPPLKKKTLTPSHAHNRRSNISSLENSTLSRAAVATCSLSGEPVIFFSFFLKYCRELHPLPLYGR